MLAFLIAGALVLWAGCGPSGNQVREGGEVFKRGAGKVDQFGDDLGHLGGSGVRDAGQGAAASASKEADDSARLLSKEFGITANEAREDYCYLLEAYESEGSYGAFVPWAMGALGIPTPSRIYAEGALGNLEDAVRKAEAGDALGALVSSVCAF